MKQDKLIQSQLNDSCENTRLVLDVKYQSCFPVGVTGTVYLCRLKQSDIKNSLHRQFL